MSAHPGLAIGLSALWALFLITWTIPSARAREPHEVLESFGLGILLTMVVLMVAGLWRQADTVGLWVAGWVVQVLGALLVIPAFVSLRRHGKPTDTWEHTTVVVESSVYSRFRHPMYTGTALWAAGIALGRPETASIVLAIGSIALTTLAAVKEDDYNLRRFGQPYAEYMARVPLLPIPWRSPRE